MFSYFFKQFSKKKTQCVFILASQLKKKINHTKKEGERWEGGETFFLKQILFFYFYYTFSFL